MNERHFVSALVVPLVTLGVAGVLISLSCSRTPEPPQGAVGESPDVVARIGDTVITRVELEGRLVQAIQPQEDEYPAPPRPVTAESVLQEMLGEQAMSLEGRRLGYLQDEMIHFSIANRENSLLAGKAAERYVDEQMPAHEADVEAALKANPKLTPEQARATVQQKIWQQISSDVHKELVTKFQLKIQEENFMQAALIHQRLLLHPAKPRGANEFWIKNSQVRDELSDQEKNLLLAVYQGGQFTLRDLFEVICNMAPPGRPKDLNTPAGVGRLLDGALWVPLLVAEAKVRGYDKDPKLCGDIRQMEDQRLLYKVMEEKTKNLGEPSADEIKAFFEKNPERFAQPATLKVDQIWCENLEAARKVKADLDGGVDFAAVKKTASLQKDLVAYNVYPMSEGLFWPELWQAEPNQTVGPVRGFYGGAVKWRLVKVLEKTAAKPQAYSEQLANSVKWALVAERRERVLADYRAELLQKYPHEIFQARIKDLDPLEIAANKSDK